MSKQTAKAAAEGAKYESDGKDDQDLTSVLDKNQRADLTLLIANATESMRKLINDNFDATATLNRGLLDESMSEEDKIMNPNIDPATADVDAYDRERKLKAEREKELSAPKMKELKAEALTAFDQWREMVIQRVGEVVNSKESATQQKKEARASESQPQAPSHKIIGKIVSAPSSGSTTKFKDLYPPTKTALTKLPIAKRVLILHSVLLLLLSLEHYIAPSRILLLNLTSSLKLSLKALTEDEAKVSKGLLEAAKEMTGEEETKKAAEQNKDSRKWKVGLATAAGAAIVGVTGGMAAPLVAAGVGSVMGGLGLGATAAAGYLGTVAGSSVIVGGLFGAYGGRMTGQIMDHYAREVEDFAFLPVHGSRQTFKNDKEAKEHAPAEDRRLRVTIGISGWLTEKEEIVKPWRVIGKGAEVFALRWELEALMNLGNAMTAMVTSAAWGYAQKEVIKRTIFAEMMTAMWPIGLLQISRVVDNPFSVAKSRAEKTGEVLADALVNKVQGERPVTLIGYSLGARVIYSCLMSLARRRAFGLIESVVLIGSPTPSDTNDWRVMRSVVTGRLVNVYSENDYVLGFLYRTSSIQYGVAGLQKVEGLPGVENVDVSETVNGHLRYRYLIGSILKKIGFEDIDMEEVEKEAEALKKMEEDEKEQSLTRQKDRLLKGKKGKKGGKKAEEEDANAEADELQKEVEQKTKKSMMQRAAEYLYLGSATNPAATAKEVEKHVTGVTKQIEKDPTTAQKKAGKAVTGAQKQVGDTVKGTQKTTYQWAADYMPNMPQMPNMPSLRQKK